MTDDLETKAFDDLDAISEMAETALDALARDDVEVAQDALTDIHRLSDAWDA